LDIYKITLQRNVNRPRLAIFAPYLEIVTFVRAVNLRHAEDIGKDMAKEHNFMDYIVELSSEKEFREDMELFLNNKP